MRTTPFLILAIFILNGCATRSDGGARVRPLSGYDGQTHTLPSGIPLNDGSNSANIATPYGQTQYGQPQSSAVQFPQYSQQPVEFSNNADDNIANYPMATATTPQQASNTALIPVQNNNSPSTSTVNNAYNPSQNQTGAVQSLLDEANAAVKANQLEKAATALNRAVRLEPNNASIWYDLAQIRLHQSKYDQSEQLAKKSIDFAKGNQDLVNKNWRVISLARKARGDTAGSDEASRNIQ